MRTIFAAVSALIFLAVASRAENWKELSLDDPSSVSPKIEADTEIKTEGKGSLKITTLWPTTVCLGEVEGPGIEGASLVYSARVKTDLDGTAFLEMWVHLSGGQYFSRGMNDFAGKKTDWKTIRTPFIFQSGQKPDKITLNLVINGKGTVWIDEVVLSKEPLK